MAESAPRPRPNQPLLSSGSEPIRPGLLRNAGAHSFIDRLLRDTQNGYSTLSTNEA